MKRSQPLLLLAGQALGAAVGSGGVVTRWAATVAAAAAARSSCLSQASSCYYSSASDVLSQAPPAFVFDIDGVLVQGRNTLPQAKRALAKLYSSDGSRPLYPLAFLTNGGGVTERYKAHQLSEWLGVHVDESQVVLSHTPFRQLATQYADGPVLVAGRGQVLDVAHHYGFRHVVNMRQLARAMPAAVPFHEDQGLLPGSDLPAYTKELKYGSPQYPIRAIMIFTDPADWYRDLQLMIDVLLSRGAPGHAPPPGMPPVDVYISNTDLLWANEFAAPRFGQGAFAACLEALYEKVSGQPLQARVFGKPHLAPYLMVEQLLLAQAQQLGLGLPAAATVPEAAQPGAGARVHCSGQLARTPPPFSAIYAVGDNPAADVRGANSAGAPWVSVLVCRTGVAQENCAANPAQVVVNDVEAAVEAALHRTRHSKWHSMR